MTPRLRRSCPPERVAVIGAGVAGLSTAWFLWERGVSVTVYDRGEVGAGSSLGKAGWIVPELVEPLPNGLPLVGATSSPRVFACSGHGMWGMVLGPVSRRLLADLVTTGAAVPALAPFDPARGQRSPA